MAQSRQDDVGAIANLVPEATMFSTPGRPLEKGQRKDVLARYATPFNYLN